MDRAHQLKFQKGKGHQMEWDSQVVRRGESQNTEVSAKITDDAFSCERIGPIGVFSQILWVIFTMFKLYLKLKKWIT